MAAVSLAEVDPQRRSAALVLHCPGKLAVKIMKPAMLHDLSQEGMDPRRLADREAELLGRLMALSSAERLAGLRATRTSWRWIGGTSRSNENRGAVPGELDEASAPVG